MTLAMELQGSVLTCIADQNGASAPSGTLILSSALIRKALLSSFLVKVHRTSVILLYLSLTASGMCRVGLSLFCGSSAFTFWPRSLAFVLPLLRSISLSKIPFFRV